LQICIVGAAVTRESRVLGFALMKGNDSNLMIGTEFKVSIMHERMSRILLSSDTFITLPGGILSLKKSCLSYFGPMETFIKSH